MKQKDVLSASHPTRFTFTSHCQKTPSHKKYYSPKLLTRRTQRKDIPSSAFLRRKQTIYKPAVYKYLSPKKWLNEDQYTFLSDEPGEKTQRQSLKGMFELDFSRINAQKSQYTMTMSRENWGRNLFEDLHSDTCDGPVDSRQINQGQSSDRARWQECEDKHRPSFDTTADSFHQQRESLILMRESGHTQRESASYQRESKRLEEGFMVVVRENGRLKKQLQKSTKQGREWKEQAQWLKGKKQQIQEQVKEKQQQWQSTRQSLMCTISKLQEYHQQKTFKLQKQLFKKQEELSQIGKQTKHQHKLILNLYSRLEEAESGCQGKEVEVKQLLERLEEMKGEMDEKGREVEEKVRYGDCLEEVILELNGKIDRLRRDSIEARDLLDDREDQIDLIKEENQQNSNTLTLYQGQIHNLNHRIQQLTLKNQQIQHQLQLSRQQKPESNEQLTAFQEEISTLNSLLHLQRQHNDKLRKELSYAHMQLTLGKKHQQIQTANEINALKQRNKKLLKKIHLTLQQNSTLKSQLQTINNKSHKLSLKKFPLEPQHLDPPKTKPRFASQRFNPHRPQGQASNHLLKTANLDSDDELSFKLSPDRK